MPKYRTTLRFNGRLAGYAVHSSIFEVAGPIEAAEEAIAKAARKHGSIYVKGVTVDEIEERG